MAIFCLLPSDFVRVYSSKSLQFKRIKKLIILHYPTLVSGNTYLRFKGFLGQWVLISSIIHKMKEQFRAAKQWAKCGPPELQRCMIVSTQIPQFTAEVSAMPSQSCVETALYPPMPNSN